MGNNLVDKQTVANLDKYIDHHKLGAYQYKTEKVQAIKRHIATTIVLGDDKDQSSDDDDIVITACDSSTSESSDGSDDNDASDEAFPLAHRTLLVKVNMYLQPHLEGGQLKDQINLKTTICKRLFQGT